jgi:hypothetical protein
MTIATRIAMPGKAPAQAVLAAGGAWLGFGAINGAISLDSAHINAHDAFECRLPRCAGRASEVQR